MAWCSPSCLHPYITSLPRLMPNRLSDSAQTRETVIETVYLCLCSPENVDNLYFICIITCRDFCLIRGTTNVYSSGRMVANYLTMSTELLFNTPNMSQHLGHLLSFNLDDKEDVSQATKKYIRTANIVLCTFFLIRSS